MEERLTYVPCAICGTPVRVSDCKTNEIGEPVHASCLAERTKSKDDRKHNAALEHLRLYFF